MIPIVFKAKPYVSKYLQQYMPDGRLDRTSIPGKYFISLLFKGTNHRSTSAIEGKRYKETVIVYVSRDAFERYGQNLSLRARRQLAIGELNVSQTMDFNDFVSKMVREQFRFQIAAYLNFDPNLNRAIAFSRAFFGISEDDFEDEAIRKDLQRYRAATGKLPNLYKKTGTIVL